MGVDFLSLIQRKSFRENSIGEVTLSSRGLPFKTHHNFEFPEVMLTDWTNLIRFEQGKTGLAWNFISCCDPHKVVLSCSENLTKLPSDVFLQWCFSLMDQTVQ